MFKFAIFLPLLALAACSAQSRVDDARMICRDGVEYMAIRTARGGISVVPHFKPDGSLYTCRRNPAQ